MENLPNEIMGLVFRHLSIHDKVVMSGVNHRYHELLKDIIKHKKDRRKIITISESMFWVIPDYSVNLPLKTQFELIFRTSFRCCRFDGKYGDLKCQYYEIFENDLFETSIQDLLANIQKQYENAIKIIRNRFNPYRYQIVNSNPLSADEIKKTLINFVENKLRNSIDAYKTHTCYKNGCHHKMLIYSNIDKNIIVKYKLNEQDCDTILNWVFEKTPDNIYDLVSANEVNGSIRRYRILY